MGTWIFLKLVLIIFLNNLNNVCGRNLPNWRHFDSTNYNDYEDSERGGLPLQLQLFRRGRWRGPFGAAPHPLEPHPLHNAQTTQNNPETQADGNPENPQSHSPWLPFNGSNLPSHLSQESFSVSPLNSRDAKSILDDKSFLSPISRRQDGGDNFNLPTNSRQNGGDEIISAASRRQDGGHNFNLPANRRQDGGDNFNSPTNRRQDGFDNFPSPTNRRQDSVHNFPSPTNRRQDSFDKFSSPTNGRQFNVDNFPSPTNRRQDVEVDRKWKDFFPRPDHTIFKIPSFSFSKQESKKKKKEGKKEDLKPIQTANYSLIHHNPGLPLSDSLFEDGEPLRALGTFTVRKNLFPKNGNRYQGLYDSYGDMRVSPTWFSLEDSEKGGRLIRVAKIEENVEKTEEILEKNEDILEKEEEISPEINDSKTLKTNPKTQKEEAEILTSSVESSPKNYERNPEILKVKSKTKNESKGESKEEILTASVESASQPCKESEEVLKVTEENVSNKYGNAREVSPSKIEANEKIPLRNYKSKKTVQEEIKMTSIAQKEDLKATQTAKILEDFEPTGRTFFLEAKPPSWEIPRGNEFHTFTGRIISPQAPPNYENINNNFRTSETTDKAFQSANNPRKEAKSYEPLLQQNTEAKSNDWTPLIRHKEPEEIREIPQVQEEIIQVEMPQIREEIREIVQFQEEVFYPEIPLRSQFQRGSFHTKEPQFRKEKQIPQFQETIAKEIPLHEEAKTPQFQEAILTAEVSQFDKKYSDPPAEETRISLVTHQPPKSYRESGRVSKAIKHFPVNTRVNRRKNNTENDKMVPERPTSYHAISKMSQATKPFPVKTGGNRSKNNQSFEKIPERNIASKTVISQIPQGINSLSFAKRNEPKEPSFLQIQPHFGFTTSKPNIPPVRSGKIIKAVSRNAGKRRNNFDSTTSTPPTASVRSRLLIQTDPRKVPQRRSKSVSYAVRS